MFMAIVFITYNKLNLCYVYLLRLRCEFIFCEKLNLPLNYIVCDTCDSIKLLCVIIIFSYSARIKSNRNVVVCGGGCCSCCDDFLIILVFYVCNDLC